MGNRYLRLKSSLAAALLLMAAQATRAEEPKKPMTPADVIREVGYEQRLNAQLPLDAEFRDETGRTVTLREYTGKRPLVLALVYYDCPMLCTMILDGLTSSLKAVNLDVGIDFDVVAVSFDPRETPELAAEKKQMHVKDYRRAGSERGWHFLTGDEAAIQQVTEAVGFKYYWDEESQQFAHASGVIVVTPEGRLARYFYGIEYPPRDLRLGLVEASAGNIGSPVDQILLYCFHYDPASGKYSLVVMNVVRALGTATVILIAGFVVLMLRRERRGELHARMERT